MRKASVYRICLLLALVLQVGVLLGVPLLLPEIIRPLLVIIVLIVIPGALTTIALYRNQPLPFWQIVGLGLGFGLGEALVLGRLLIILGLATTWLGVGMLLLSVLLVGWLWRQAPIQVKPSPVEDWRLFIIPAAIVGALWIMLVQVNLTYPAYPVDTVVLNDKWTYLAIIQQFLVSPAHLNLRADSVIVGTNTRLAWNSWVYLTAAISTFTGIQPVPLIFHYLRPGLFLWPVLSLFLLGYELFQKRAMALAAVALHLLLLIGVDFYGYWVWMRLDEDKYFAFVALMALAWVFLLRALRTRRFVDMAGLIAVSISLALIHPLGIPGLLLTAVPFTVVEWRLNRFSVRWLALLLVSMGAPIIITLIDQKMVLATAYVQSYVTANGSLPTFTLANVPNLLPPNSTFMLLLLVPLMFFALKDRTARFLLLTAAFCIIVLSVPIVTYLVSRLTTATGMNRYHWLIPYGFIVVWLIWKIVPWFATKSTWRWLRPTTLLAGSILVIVVISGWYQWTVDHNFWLFRQGAPTPKVVLSDDLWQGFVDSANSVAGQRTIAPVEYGLVAPTVWPDADLLVFNSPIPAPKQWADIAAFYQSQDMPTVWTFLDKLQAQALFVPRAASVYGVLSQHPDTFKVLYEGKAASVFGTNAVPTLHNNDVIAFNADQYTLKPGECTQIQWATQMLTNVRLDGNAEPEASSRQLCPAQDTVLTLEGTRPDGSAVQQNLHLFVSPTFDYLLNFNADRYIIQPGECTTLQWHAEGIDSIYFDNGATLGMSIAKKCPTKDTVYPLRVKLRNQQVILRNIAIYVRNGRVNQQLSF